MSIAPEKAHSVLSPSSADRWATCLGALAACKDIPEKRTNEAAALGTAKHAISEYILRGEFPERGCTSQVGQTVEADGFTFEIDDEFADHVDVYVNYVNSRPGRKLLEVSLSTAHILGVNGQGGTSDCIHLDYEQRQIEVIDAKFGYNPVSAQHRQLRIYGAAALTLFDLEGEWDTVRCTIVQPKDAPAVKTHVYTRAEIEAFIADIAPKAQQAFRLYQSPPVDLLRHLTPSDEACAWCPLAGSCAARANRFANMFDDCSKAEPVTLSDARLAELLAATEGMVEWAKAIAAEAHTRAVTLGKSLPGFEVAIGRRGARRWAEGSEDAITGTLVLALSTDDMYARKLKSPKQVEVALKAANAKGLMQSLVPYITQSDGQPRLVPSGTTPSPVKPTKVEFEVVS